MKIRCDVCDREEASVFCSADEAALCDGCDRRVHHANKLAGKHPRFSLLQPAFKESPLCDICQERRAFLFCQEDRAILCRECDIPIHRANEHTQKHNRFLLTGVKLSASSTLYQSPASAASSAAATAAETSSSAAAAAEMSALASTSDNGSYSTSSISEYLMETLPGWHVEDFLDPSSFASNGFCKTNSQVMPFVNKDDDDEFESNKSSLSVSSSEDLGNNWLPQNLPHITTFYPSNSGVFGAVKAQDMMFNQNRDDICCTVPYITPPTSKRRRQNFH